MAGDNTFTFFTVNPPSLWRAGFAGSKPFYFGCSECEAREVPIAGYWGTGTTFECVAIRTDGKRGPRHAMLCEPCTKKVLENHHETANQLEQ